MDTYHDYAIAVITPVANRLTDKQWVKQQSQQSQLHNLHSLAMIEYAASKFRVRHWYASDGDSYNRLRDLEGLATRSTNLRYDTRLLCVREPDQVTRRTVATKDAVKWLAKTAGKHKLLVWLDADDVPTGYWLACLTQCRHAFNVLAVTRPGLAMFARQYAMAGRDAFKRLRDGACGVGCGSAIVWRYDLAKTVPWLLTQLKLSNPLYQRYCGIEDVVLAIEVARKYPYDLGYVTSDCCQDDCGTGNPAIYHVPSYELGADNMRVVRNDLLAQYRSVTRTLIQGVDGGYGSNDWER